MWDLQIELIISQACVAIVPSLNNNIYLKLSNHVTTNMYALLYIINPLYNHTHFNHILVCVIQFLVTIYFSKKHHFLESLSHSL
jgi:large-conductance mechanosensitive channel